MFVLYSSTKGLAALAMHMLRDRGRFEYDDLISRYWPEFARNGKERATIAHVLSHRVGNTMGPDWLTYKLWGDRQKCAQAMEELTPRWTPGEARKGFVRFCGMFCRGCGHQRHLRKKTVQ